MAKERPSMFFVIIPFAFKLIILQETKIKGMIFLGVTFWVRFIHVLAYKLCVSKHYINESSSCIEVAIVADDKKVPSKMDVRHLTKYLHPKTRRKHRSGNVPCARIANLKGRARPDVNEWVATEIKRGSVS